MDLVHYNCLTAAGLGADALMSGLYAGTDHSEVIGSNHWPQPVVQGGRVCFIKNKTAFKSDFDKISFYLDQVIDSFFETLNANDFARIKNEKVLVLLSSTKGLVEDYIWQFEKNKSDLKASRTAPDPFQQILELINVKISAHGIQILNSEVVSNACSSTHVANQMAKKCLDSNFYDHVFVISADLIGAFIYSGFSALKVLSQTVNKPFSADRDGLQLGEAVTILLFSKKSDSSKIKICHIASHTEGGSVTRPSLDGKSLVHVMKKCMTESKISPDLFLAHGTGTRFNDLSEALAIYQICAEDILKMNKKNCFVTSIKWSIGHTLGASGALDLIAASEIIRHQKIFKIQNTLVADSDFKSDFAVQNNPISDQISVANKIENIMITSLGFGGVHAAILIQ